MKQTSGSAKKPAEAVLKDIRRATRRQFSAGDPILPAHKAGLLPFSLTVAPESVDAGSPVEDIVPALQRDFGIFSNGAAVAPEHIASGVTGEEVVSTDQTRAVFEQTIGDVPIAPERVIAIPAKKLVRAAANLRVTLVAATRDPVAE